MDFLVDTSVLVELAREKPHPGVEAWAQTVERVALSAVTVEELTYDLSLRGGERMHRGSRSSSTSTARSCR